MVILLLMLLCSSTANGAAPEGKVDAQLTTTEDVWVGQRVPMTVKILAPGFSISGVPIFEFPEISGLLVLKLPGSPRIGNETLNEVSYVTQIHEFALFSQRAGQIQIPPFPVRFASSAGYGQPVTSFTVNTQPLQFTVRLPPGAENLRTLISTPRLSLKESWSPDLHTAKVGDAVTRTITFHAADIPGMEFPPLTVGPLPGVGIYPKPPVVQDDSQKGSLNGERIETVTFVFEKPGTVTFPEETLTWFDLTTKTLRHETIPERTISVTGSVSASSRPQNSSAIRSNQVSIWIAGLTVLGGMLAAMFCCLLRRRTAPADQEAALFAALKAACRADDHKQILCSLTEWVDHTSLNSEPAMLQHWAIQTGDGELVTLIAQLESEFYQRSLPSTAPCFSGRRLLECVVRFHRRRSRIQLDRSGHSALVPLNPP
jgi:hypothetical protein